MTSKSQVFNSAALSEILELERTGNPGLLESLITHFETQAPHLIEGIATASEERNFSNLEHHAHSLKSSSRLLGFESLADICYDIENEARVHLVDLLKTQRLAQEFTVAFERILEFKKNLN